MRGAYHLETGLLAVAALAVAVSCGTAAPPGSDATDATDAADAVLAFTDISAASPDLAANTYRGEAGWDHGDKYAPGVALVDLDGDGILDLAQPRNDRTEPAYRALRLYRGRGDGGFDDVTAVVWDESRNATGIVAFDYDGDDDLDLFIAVDGGPSVLYRNDGDWRFTDVAAEAGVALSGVRAFTAAAADIDGDRDLDLYVGAWNASAADHGAGTAPNILLRNNGDATFTDITAAAGVACDGSATLGVGFADFDGDGDVDLFVANDFFDDCLFDNRTDGSFVEVAAAAGVATGAFNGMGVGIGDIDGDGDFDLVVTDDEVVDDSRGNAVYINEGAMSFSSRGVEFGLDGINTLQADWLVCWGLGLVDLDLDGDLDAHITTHGLRSELLWQQQPGPRFVPQYDLMFAMEDVDGRGSAYGDIDGDGDLDIIVARRGAGLQVLRNDTGTGNWLRVAPWPPSGAPGAVVTIEADGRRQRATIQAGSGYMSTSPPTVTFGLGGLDIVDAVEVQFTDGSIRRVETVAANRELVVTREP